MAWALRHTRYGITPCPAPFPSRAAALQPVAFQRLSPTAVAFYRLVLMQVLLPESDPQAPVRAGAGTETAEAERLVRVFQRAREPEDLQQGLSFFLQAYVRPLASSAAASDILSAADRAVLKRTLRLARGAMRGTAEGDDL